MHVCLLNLHVPVPVPVPVDHLAICECVRNLVFGEPFEASRIATGLNGELQRTVTAQ
jgi:hypothetical protein